ncbi:Ig-like domain-containing protein [Photobacterium ganghwense]|uniref:Ig-like domain-containing protein n=1 Tax=Photobacterium ganghwense TaxID=320778 RepID=UPI001A8E35F5|nr:Ig-like domain-containing protein [Photobacterium ganghwense]QSV17506.1 DUF4165 domain-containing protein [Photobacterium ganghwense]
MRLHAIAITLCGCVVLPVQAELLSTEFLDTNGKQRTISPNQRYANPTGQMSFALSAGIDRRVRVTLLDHAGQLVEQSTSDLLGSSNRISVNGKSFYGAYLSLGSPSDGEYQIKAEILSAAGTSVQTDVYPLIIDTQKPGYNSVRNNASGYRMTTTGDVWKLGNGGSGDSVFIVDGIHSATPIKSVKIHSYREDGTLYTTREASFDATIFEAQVSFERFIFPDSDLDEAFTFTFEIEDEAGNRIITAPQKVFYDNITNAPKTPFAVFNPDATTAILPGLTGFVPYKAGMEVRSNPIELIWQVPRTNWHRYREGGLTITNALGKNEVVYEDADYVYILNTAPYGNLNGNYWRFNNFGQWGGSYISYNLKLSDSAPVTPRLMSVEYNFSDVGWRDFYRYEVDNSVLPVTINGVKVVVEPRPYPQVAVHNGECTIPVGKSECFIDWQYTMKTGENGYLHDNASVFDANRTLRSPPMWAETHFNDAFYPEITTKFEESTNKLSAFIRQKGRGAYFDRLRLKESWLEDGNGRVLDVAKAKTAENGEYYTYEFDLNTLPEGQFNLHVVAQERHGPKTRQPLFEFTSDNTPPSLTVHAPSTISSLDDITITLSDGVDPAPQLTAIRLAGGPSLDDVQLSWRSTGTNTYMLEYPVLFPSLKTGQEYQLTALASDAQGNIAEQKVTFDYSPPRVELSYGVDGKVLIPAVAQAVRRNDGTKVITSEPYQIGSTTIGGTYPITATLSSDTEIPLTINGVTLYPGDTHTVDPAYNFGRNAGRLSLDVAPVEGEQMLGQANILFTTTAPNAPVLVANVQTWKPAIEVATNSDQIRQGIDPVTLTARALPASQCRVTGDPAVAMKSDVLLRPVCLVKWVNLPHGMAADASKAEAHGKLVRADAHDLMHEVYLLSGNGDEILLDSQLHTLQAQPADNSVVMAPASPEQLEKVNMVIQDILFTNKVTSDGARCRITFDQTEAVSAAPNSHTDNRICLFEWTAIPDGLTQVDDVPRPELEGRITEAGVYPVSWQLTLFADAQTPVMVAKQTFDLTVVEPPLPNIGVKGVFPPVNEEEGIYLMEMAGGKFADVLIDIVGSAFDLSVQVGNEPAVVESFPPSTGTRAVSRRIDLPEGKLWQAVPVTVTVNYSEIPSLKNTRVLHAYYQSPGNIKPVIMTETDTAVDNAPLTLQVGIRDNYRQQDPYNPDTMGVWDVKLVREMNYNQTEDVTDWTPAPSGDVSFDVDTSRFGDSASVRLVAMAKLRSPLEDEGFERIERGHRTAFFSVLKGTAVNGEVQVVRESGVAPFTGIFKIKLENYSDNRAAGTVVWEVSSDGGNRWETYEPADRYKMQYRRVFERGSYLVRAKIVNANSGIEQYTNTVNVVAYNGYELDVEGPRSLFATATGKFTAVAKLDGVAVEPSEVKIEWSHDGGKTYTYSGPTHSITSNELGRLKLWARVRDINAPDDDRGAWQEWRSSVEFNKFKSPRVRLSGERVVEVGKTYTFTAQTSLPYNYMSETLVGRFTLPDGRTVVGESVEYTVREEDLQDRYLQIGYEAEIVGYEAQTATTVTHRARAWQYVWPNFSLSLRSSAAVYPATVTASIRPIGFSGKLEDPSYRWQLPEGVKIIDQRRPETVVFEVSEAVDGEISVQVGDSRLHETVKTEPLVIGEPEPYQVALSLHADNPYMRAPLGIRLRSQIDGGHPRDRIAQYVFAVNGEEEVGNSGWKSLTLPAGTHDISLTVHSQMGKAVTETVRVEVVPNQPPECRLESRESFGSVISTAVCDDPDGRVRNYAWEVDGIPSVVKSSRLSVSLRNHGGVVPPICVVATDDGGAASATTCL